jgi:hypothetical protein
MYPSLASNPQSSCVDLLSDMIIDVYTTPSSLHFYLVFSLSSRISHYIYLLHFLRFLLSVTFSVFFSLVTLTVLRSTHQVFCISFNWYLVLFLKLHRGCGSFEEDHRGKVISHPIISRVHTINMIYATDANIDNLALITWQCLLISFPHSKITPSLLFYTVVFQRKPVYAGNWSLFLIHSTDKIDISVGYCSSSTCC